MRFRITMSRTVYAYDEQLAEVRKLKKLGFTFEEVIEDRAYYFEPEDNEVYEDFATLEELMDFINDFGGEAVIRDKNILEIYNGYRE